MSKQEIIVKDENQISQVNTNALMQIADEYAKGAQGIQVPANYDVNNAVKTFCLTLAQTKDKNGHRALDVCTPESIVAAMQQMISSGLNPTKKQGYLIVRDKSLNLNVGAFGNVKIMKDVTGYDMFSDVIYEGDKVKITKRKDGSKIIEVETSWDNIQKGTITGAYAVVSDRGTGNVIDSDIMTMQEIRTSWGQSATKDLTTHKKFPHEMARKTVESRLAKRFVNTSDDSRKYADLEKYVLDETEYGVINADEELEANAVVNLDNQENVIQAQADDYSISTLQLDDLDEPKEFDGIEIPYREYKDNQDKYELIPNSYNAQTRTCFVRAK